MRNARPPEQGPQRQPRTTAATRGVMRAPAGSARRSAGRRGERARARPADSASPTTHRRRRPEQRPGRHEPDECASRDDGDRDREPPRRRPGRVEKRQHPRERERGRDGQREREPVEPCDRLPREGKRDVDRQHDPARRGAADSPRPATKTSGKVTESATEATMYGAIATTRRPIWVPTSSPYALPRTRPAISAPATAKIPAVAATARSAGQADASTWRAHAMRLQAAPGQRHCGDQPERRGTDADDGGRDQVRVAEARHRADALARGDR